MQLPSFQYGVRRSHNDVCASTKLFSLNLCLILLRILKGCFVDLGNGLQLTIRTHLRLIWIIISEYYIPTMNIYDLCSGFCRRFIPPLQLLENVALKSMFGKQQLKMSQSGHYTHYTADYQTPEHVGKMLISTIKSVQFPFKVRFSDSQWSPLLPPHKISKFCTESL